ncbi:MAG: hypothetical protein AVDCRST_MAG28-3138 [uncultured Rubrobacteraceae bacterium]|uniref:Uncharacterized protein n=1 Tax=uncultured Rubrobacteraceae bacterium TaxID=349277 RepID=A0A6J4R0N4_9ACTN|nr:MAG: hypothetical protein AVDCRST_MAG28-3138 [uncultured Rubrobacteraceae bacterium]
MVWRTAVSGFGEMRSEALYWDVYLKSWVGSLTRYGEVIDLFFSVYGGPVFEASSEA